MKSARWIALVALVALVGCSKGGSSAPSTVGLDPVATMRTWQQSMIDNQPQFMWQMLPSQHQSDVKALIADFAKQVDKEVYDQSFAVLSKVSKLAKEKRDFILGTPMLAATPAGQKKDDLAKNWNSIVEMFDILLTSDIKTADGLAKVDPEAFLAKTGGKLMEHGKKLGVAFGGSEVDDAMSDLKNTKLTLVSTEGDTATVKVESPKETKEVKLKKIEGKWVPEEEMAGWDGKMADARAKLADMKLSPEKKASALELLKLVDAAADELMEAKTQEEFNSAVQAQFLTAMGAIGPLMQGK